MILKSSRLGDAIFASDAKKLKFEKFKLFAASIALSAAIGLLSGFASALFLFALDVTTRYREANLKLIYFLPLAGLLVGLLYKRYGARVDNGNNLVIDELHNPKSVIPLRMAPLVFISTIVTHLVGGSAGREGTAVQMGACIADQFSITKQKRSKIHIHSVERRKLLMIGMSAGFGSVFGVPFAGTIFGMEVLSIGKIEWSVLIECAVATFVAHKITLACGIHHTPYTSPFIPSLSLSSVVSVIASGLIFGVVARMFVWLTEEVKTISKKVFPNLPIRSLFGGLIVATVFVCLPVTLRYSGLGVPVIVSATQQPLPRYDWIGKAVLTALTLGTGFKGGEVTPLLFIGATLGNALGQLLPVAFSLLAAVGLVSVFAGAANTPLACTLMAMELFGPQIMIYAAISTYSAYLLSGHRGIYTAQRIHHHKLLFWRKHKLLFWRKPFTLFSRFSK